MQAKALSNSKVNILVVGAGEAGQLVAQNIARNKESAFRVIGFIDDDSAKHGKKIEGIPVLGAIEDIGDIAPANNVEELLITIPSRRGEVVQRTIESTIGLKLVYKILPRIPEVLMQSFSEDYMRYIRKVEAEDLLGGEILKSDQAQISKHAESQVVLITGAAGSIGSELSRQIAAHNAKKIIFYDWWENGMFDLRNQLLALHPNGDYEFIIGDVKDRRKLDKVMAIHEPTTIFHAAAYKHVPLMEENAAEAIKNNILGTKNVAELAIKHKAKKFVLVSTDKAVNPTNVMGATKRAAEMVIHILSQGQTDTTFCAVRFGNVINSNGSAIPLFVGQIEKGGPVTVTHKDITRFFMTIPEAVHLILQSWVMGQNNDLFVLDMGQSVKIYDLARLLIALHGYVPDKDIKIQIIGLRPGEKLYEEVLVKEEETLSTPFEKIFRTKSYMEFDKFAFLNNLMLLEDSLEENDLNLKFIKSSLKKMVDTYQPKG